MPYKNNKELPSAVQHVLTDEHALDIYREAYNAAWGEYKEPGKRRDPHEDRVQIAHKVAWAAVKKKYSKADDGLWYRKGSA